MVISLDPELEKAVNEEAGRQGMAPEVLALKALRERFLTTASLLEPRDEWERRLREIATDCGVSLSNAALSRDELYD